MELVQAGQRPAAVAAILRASEHGSGSFGLDMLLIKRAERAGDVWSGHVALPGGRHEDEDEDLVATAVRETLEEIHVDLARHAQLLGALPLLAPMNPRLPPISVQPFVWMVDRPVDPSTSDEVAAVAWVSVAHLLDSANHIEHRVAAPDGVEHAFPAIDVGLSDVAGTDAIAGAAAASPLWGMTHRIVTSLLDVIVEP